MVYHYTSLEGFRGIAQSSVLWMRCAQSMGDKSEVKMLLLDFHRMIKNDGSVPEAAKTALHSFFRDFEDEQQRFRDAYPTPGPSTNNDEPYCFSLSLTKQNDNPAHWTEYGNKGEGLALGFDERYLKALRKRLLEHGHAVDLVYGDIAYKGSRRYSRKLKRLYERIKEDILGPRSDDGNVWYDDLESLLEQAHLAKEGKYVIEDEKRLSLRCFLDHLPDIHGYLEDGGQDRNGLPKVDLVIPKNGFLREVIVGPNCGESPAQIQKVLKANGFKGVIVKRSAISWEKE